MFHALMPTKENLANETSKVQACSRYSFSSSAEKAVFQFCAALKATTILECCDKFSSPKTDKYGDVAHCAVMRGTLLEVQVGRGCLD